MKNYVFVYAYIVGIDKVYNCNFSLNLCLMDNLNILYELINEEMSELFVFDKHILVYEGNLNLKLNLFINLENLNISDGTYLVVY